MQIHHIDEDPSNNNLENLTVLCLDCHNLTLIKGGYGRQLDSYQIRRYKDEWLNRIANGKTKSNHEILKNKIEEHYEVTQDKRLIDIDKIDNIDGQIFAVCKLLNALPVMEKAQETIGKAKFSEGTTLAMNQCRGYMISFYEGILLELSFYYPKNHFSSKGPKLYFRKLITHRFAYYRLVLETYGVGTGGRILSVNCAGMVAYDIKRMIADMADALTYHNQVEGTISLDKWRRKWLLNS